MLKADHSLALASSGVAKLYPSRRFSLDLHRGYGIALAAAGLSRRNCSTTLAVGADPNATRTIAEAAHYTTRPMVTSMGQPGMREGRWKPSDVWLDAGAEINAQDKNGATPLHRAVRTRCAAAVRCLLEAAVDPTLKNKPGSTPFHLAVQNSGRGGTGADVAIDAQRKIVEELLSFGLSPGS